MGEKIIIIIIQPIIIYYRLLHKASQLGTIVRHGSALSVYIYIYRLFEGQCNKGRKKKHIFFFADTIEEDSRKDER